MSKKQTYTIINKKGDVEFIEKDTSKRYKNVSIPFSSKYANLGFFLITPMLIGIFAGKYLDKRYGTGTLWTTFLLIFGTITTFYNLFKFIKDATDDTPRSNRNPE